MTQAQPIAAGFVLRAQMCAVRHLVMEASHRPPHIAHCLGLDCRGVSAAYGMFWPNKVYSPTIGAAGPSPAAPALASMELVYRWKSLTRIENVIAEKRGSPSNARSAARVR